MNKDEALKMAIEWVEGWKGIAPSKIELLRVLREALAQPAQEPVGKWESKCKCDLRTKLVGDGCRYCNTEEYIDRLHSDYNDLLDENEQLLSHPAPSFIGLSDDEIDKLYADWERGQTDYLNFARAIEQALKEKNHAL